MKDKIFESSHVFNTIIIVQAIWRTYCLQLSSMKLSLIIIVRSLWMCLKESHGGSTLDCAIIDHILVSKVFKALNGDMFVVGVQCGAEVAKVAGQQQYSKQPPDGAD